LVESFTKLFQSFESFYLKLFAMRELILC